MLKWVYDADSERLIRTEEAAPKCGVDFCENCGQCLHCYQDDPCTSEAGHWWVVYEVTEDSWQKKEKVS